MMPENGGARRRERPAAVGGRRDPSQAADAHSGGHERLTVDSDAPDFAGTKEDVDGFEDTDGCPDADNDEDAVPDTEDGPLCDPDYPAYGVCRDGAGPTANELHDKGFVPPWSYKNPETVWPGCRSVPTPRCEWGKLQVPFKINFR